ncbi:MAG: enoyl-CoA hydratase/isomerase family protein [Ignavibacteriales bacterium]|nr:enoyl-CoA hydratase/isomerase family protein [Ignavibacteriales bacterium]MCF8306203.1 enoyl-CoA hydratase/isomerase family protein [Ignavibacteriales bacterium]MCF8315924.1 enoyl-CoA hydratase/isomerase family protein [Ignavibacteriales bacterium]MCF8437518.1 enoyl-CoA hydratase/isomerase family protein [Ignavibacteriales bacterium]
MKVYENIKVSRIHNLSIITLDRPEVLNSIDSQMAEEFIAALEDLSTDADTRAVMIRGEGRAFCAGQDLSDAIKINDIGSIIDKYYNPIILTIRRMEKPVIAAVNGIAAGAGANIALACDIVLASSGASFIQAFSKIGLIPDSGGTWFLPRLAGFNLASALMITGDKLSAEDAFRYGIVYRVFEAENFAEEAEAFGLKISAMPTKGIALTKKALNESFKNDLKTQLELEKFLQIQAADTEDFREGVEAFLQKRKPEFRGK